jgi:small GTP-binding protein
VDATPGTTRDPVTGRFAADGVRFEVVDTAGLRRRARVHEPVEYYSTQRSVAALEQSDVVVLLADAQEEIAEQDKRLASLAVRKGNGLVVALNKWDLFQPHQRAADGVRFEVVDTAGLRRRARVHEPVEYYSTQRSVAALEQSDVVVLLADAQEEIAEQDKRLASLAVRKGNGLVVALNKWDLFQPHQRDQVIARARYHLPALAYVPLVTLSARERTGVSSLTEACVAVSRQRARLVSTSRINDAVRRWNRTPGAADSGRRAAPGRPPLRVQYGVQTGTSPVRLLFFVNRAQVPAHYRRFLENRARADLGFDRVPIIIEVRGPPGRERPGRERPGRERPGRERSGRR